MVDFATPDRRATSSTLKPSMPASPSTSRAATSAASRASALNGRAISLHHSSDLVCRSPPAAPTFPLADGLLCCDRSPSTFCLGVLSSPITLRPRRSTGRKASSHAPPPRPVLLRPSQERRGRMDRRLRLVRCPQRHHRAGLRQLLRDPRERQPPGHRRVERPLRGPGQRLRRLHRVRGRAGRRGSRGAGGDGGAVRRRRRDRGRQRDEPVLARRCPADRRRRASGRPGRLRVRST